MQICICCGQLLEDRVQECPECMSAQPNDSRSVRRKVHPVPIRSMETVPLDDPSECPKCHVTQDLMCEGCLQWYCGLCMPGGVCADCEVLELVVKPKPCPCLVHQCVIL